MLSERDRASLPDWAEQERAGDLASIVQNVRIFLPAAQQGYELYGRGAVAVDTTSRPTGEGHAFGYFPQEMIEHTRDEDTWRMVQEYDPTAEFVTVLLKLQDRVSSYRLQVHSEAEKSAPHPPDLETLMEWEGAP